MRNPNVLFLDEPFTALDGYGALKLYGILKKLNRDEHVTIVVISHDVDTILRYANHVIHVDETIVFDGTKEEYLESSFMKEYKGGNE